MTSSPLKHRALKGATWAAVGGNGAQALAFVMFVAISRVVGPEAFGAIAVCLLLVEAVRALVVEPVGVCLVSRGKIEPTEFHAGFAVTAASGVVAALTLIAATPLLTQLFDMPVLSTVLPQMAPLIVVHAVARVMEAELTLRLEFRALAIRSIGAVILGGGAGIAAAYAGYGIVALILQQWISVVAALVLLGAQARLRGGLGFSRRTLIALIRDSAAIAPVGVLANIRQTVDGLTVAAFSGAAAVGVYNLAKRARLALQLGLSAAIARVSLPTFGMIKQDEARIASAVEQAMRLSAIIAFPVFVGISAVAPELINLSLGPEWAGAALPMALLMIGGALSITTNLCENFLLVLGRRTAIVYINLAALALLGFLLVVLGPFGPSGVAAAVLAISVFQNIATSLTTLRAAPRLRTATYIRNVWVPMAICLAMLLLIGVIRGVGAGGHHPQALHLIAYILLGALFYCAATWIFARAALLAAINAGRVVLSLGSSKT